MTKASANRTHRLTIAICAAGHSGSTLLGMVLGSHSAIFHAGEAKKSRFLDDPDKPLRKRVCKICGEGCPVWGELELPPRPDLYEALARRTGRPIVVDSTKDVDWIRERAEELDRLGVPHRRVFLTRDGRAVVNSRLRKEPGRAPAVVVDEWVAQVRAVRALVEERPDEAITVRYEELATTPEPVVRRLCDFLGVPFEPGMLDYASHPHHVLGGNTGTQSVVARARGLDAAFAEVPDRSRGYYADLDGGFRLDLRWRDELDAAARDVFERRAGSLNRAFAWEGALA